jgi:broad specificity phosphatase PhoE
MRLNLTPTRPLTATFDILEARARNRGASAMINSDLVEWNYGQYEGLTPKQIHETTPGWLGCPGGEAPEQVGARVDRVIARKSRRTIRTPTCCVCWRRVG